MQNFVGKQIDRYRIIAQQGMGGMAVVYQAYDTRLERDVAVKVIRTEAIPPEQYARLMGRFEREAKAQGGFSHPNIVPVYDYGEVNGSPYLVMAYIANGTLKDKLKGPIPCLQALRWLTPIASALSYAHKNGVVHRDVKPSNILFDKEGRPILTDFGIAKILETTDATLTGTGLGVGTPEYMAPEQWQGKASEASDQYALGVVLYELVTGRKPYTAETPVAVALKQMSEPLPRPRDLVRGIPEKVEKVLYKALAPNPAHRFESMQVFQTVLEDLVRELETSNTNEIPLTGWGYSEGETVDLLADVDSEGKTTDRCGGATQPAQRSPATHAQKQRVPRWAIWMGVGVLLLGLVCIGGAIVLSNTGLLSGGREPTQPGVSQVEAPTQPAMIVSALSETPSTTAVPEATSTPVPSLTPTEFLTPTPTVYITPTPEMYFPLPNCVASQLKMGDSAFVSYEGKENRLRTSSDLGSSTNFIDDEAQPGEVLHIIGGPECYHENYVVWEVETTRREQGWTPEGNGTVFWLLPLTTRQLCKDALPSRLAVGMRAMVNEKPDKANLLRLEPSKSSSSPSRIPPGEWMIVLDGPQCGDKGTWWLVEAEATGKIGWTMESGIDEGSNIYFLSPKP